MTFIVKKASERLGPKKNVEINTLEELIKLSEDNDNRGLIIYPDINEIIIYDDYVE